VSDDLLHDWLKFASDVQPSDAAGTDWLDGLRQRTIAALAGDGWVKCSERMPSPLVHVLGWADGWNHANPTSWDGSNWLDDESMGELPVRCWPTHWRPLPAPPKNPQPLKSTN
jgi:hypothetical protein